MPVDLFNIKLGHDMEKGRVIFTENAARHAKRRHHDDYEAYFPYLSEVIANPLFIGDDFKNHGNVEIIGRGEGMVFGDLILIAVNVELDENGHYHIRSFYPVSNKKVDTRREKGYLVSAL